MNLLWEYQLPNHADPRDALFEGPLCVHRGQVYFAGYAGTGRRPDLVRIHRIDPATGGADTFDFDIPKAPLPSQWSWTSVGKRLLFHAATFIDCTGDPVRITGLADGELVADKYPMRPQPLNRDNGLYFSNRRTGELICFDFIEKRSRWSECLTPVEPYMLGAPLPFGDQVSCFGRGGLSIFDGETGEERERLTIPRISKLYSPIADGDDLLFGYTNWSVTGVLRVDPSGKVKWRYRRSFEGPNTYCRIWQIEDVVVFVKGETEILGVDRSTGEERWRHPAHPYLYTRLQLIGADLVFGTAGGSGGGLRRISALTGELRWERILNNGCSYYALQGDRLYVGDFDKHVYCLDANTGKELDRIDVGTQVVGDFAVDEERVYTVIWPGEDRPARLICIQT